MEKLKQISVKIDPETLRRLDECAGVERYWKRNALINGILTAVIDCCEHREVMKLARYWRGNPKTKPRISVDIE